MLKEIAAFLGRNMRKDDVVARLGGDEFAVFAAGLVPGPALERVLAQLSGGIYARNPRPADMPGRLAAFYLDRRCGLYAHLRSPSMTYIR